MPRIGGWEKTISRGASSVDLAGVVLEWHHAKSEDVIQVKKVDPYEGELRYDVIYNGDTVNAHTSLAKAESAVRDCLRENEAGLPA